MLKFRSPFWESVGIIGGMIIGSGMFALPYAVWVSGFLGALLGGFLALVAVLAVHLAYGEIVSNTPGIHRLPGYAKLYLGNWAGNFEKFTQIFGFNIVLLVYGVLGGVFLSLIFGGSAYYWTPAFFVFGSAVLFWGNIEKLGFLNFLLSIPLIGAALAISFYAAGAGDFSAISFNGADPFFAFGIFMFSLTGLSVIADARGVFAGRPDGELKKSIVVGTLIPPVLYLIFILGVLMASGGAVAEDALSGLEGILGKEIIILGALVGVLAMFTSYLALGYDLKAIYEFDAVVKPFWAWLLTLLVPMVIFILGAENFIKLISIMGGLFIAFDGLFVVFILRALRKKNPAVRRFLPFGILTQVFLVLIFLASIAYELVYQVF